MFQKLRSAVLWGIDCLPLDIEVDISKGQTSFNIVGLANTSIQESRDRIHSALKNSGFPYPINFRTLINLAPADFPKEGTAYDLPMAVGIVAVTQNLQINFHNYLILGQLGLDGSTRHTTGVLAMVLYAKKNNFEAVFVPEENVNEAVLVKNIIIYPVKSLRQVIDHFTNKNLIEPHVAYNNKQTTSSFSEFDMSLIKGQKLAKRALEIAASGGHNLIMVGPPGSGKTLLARTLPTILPKLSHEESLEVTKIYSVAGQLREPYISTRPFRAPHPTISNIALIGGGRNPRPGEVSLAHRGVLFLDEFPEFNRATLESLRQPLEDGTITVSRVRGSISFPSRIMFIASQNPCPCGFYMDSEHPCTCTASDVLRYQKKVSGPVLDRIDLQIQIPRIKMNELSASESSEPSDTIRSRVEHARHIQKNRFKESAQQTNSEINNEQIKKFCTLDNNSWTLLQTASQKLHLSTRAIYRIIKIARTIADMSNSEAIQNEHVAEALQYRFN